MKTAFLIKSVEVVQVPIHNHAEIFQYRWTDDLVSVHSYKDGVIHGTEEYASADRINMKEYNLPIARFRQIKEKHPDIETYIIYTPEVEEMIGLPHRLIRDEVHRKDDQIYGLNRKLFFAQEETRTISQNMTI